MSFIVNAKGAEPMSLTAQVCRPTGMLLTESQNSEVMKPGLPKRTQTKRILWGKWGVNVSKNKVNYKLKWMETPAASASQAQSSTPVLFSLPGAWYALTISKPLEIHANNRVPPSSTVFRKYTTLQKHGLLHFIASKIPPSYSINWLLFLCSTKTKKKKKKLRKSGIENLIYCCNIK